jgi:hypothetical protein
VAELVAARTVRDDNERSGGASKVIVAVRRDVERLQGDGRVVLG